MEWPDRAIGSDGHFSPKGSEGIPRATKDLPVLHREKAFQLAI